MKITGIRAYFQSSAFHDYHSRPIAERGPVVTNGHMLVADRPGLGVEPLWDVLGKPIMEIRH